MNTPEFSREERLDAIGVTERKVAVAAEPAERTALVRRFGLIAIDALSGTFALRREGAGIRVRGRVLATVTQACSVTGEPLPATIDEPVDLMMVAQSDAELENDEIELSDDAIDTVFHDGNAIDVGEIAAETVALALEPFPRGPNADRALKEAGVLNEGEAGPFGALAALLKKD